MSRRRGNRESRDDPRWVLGSLSLVVSVEPEYLLTELRSETWPTPDDPVLDAVDLAAFGGEPAMAQLFVAVAKQLDPQDLNTLSRFGAGSVQDWLYVADKRYPEALNIITEALPTTPALSLAINEHMMMGLDELRSPPAQRLVQALQAQRRPVDPV